MMNVYLDAALGLHRYLVHKHWSEEGLIGPDPGIRFNYRIGRFVKSYLGVSFRRDDLYYLQAQGYWTLGNWLLFARFGGDAHRRIAVRCSETMLARQRSDGAWEYPNPEWKGRVATAEGTWASLGLLETYRHTSDRRFLEGALRWHDFLVASIGFQQYGDTLAVNYFAGRGGGPVPNNSAFVLRFLAELSDVTGDSTYQERSPGLLRFLEAVQRPSGELPYVAPGPDGREHFQCFQYNAFQCLDLMRYFELSRAAEPCSRRAPCTVGLGARSVPTMIGRLLAFLRTGLAPEGYAYYQCGNRHRTVAYHTAVLAAVFRKAGDWGFDGCQEAADRAGRCLLARQRPDGSFPYSRGDYRLLRDERSYPRYLAMILVHLLMQDTTPEAQPAGAHVMHANNR